MSNADRYTLPNKFNVGDTFFIKNNGNSFILSDKHHPDAKILETSENEVVQINSSEIQNGR